MHRLPPSENPRQSGMFALAAKYALEISTGQQRPDVIPAEFSNSLEYLVGLRAPLSAEDFNALKNLFPAIGRTPADSYNRLLRGVGSLVRDIEPLKIRQDSQTARIAELALTRLNHAYHIGTGRAAETYHLEYGRHRTHARKY